MPVLLQPPGLSHALSENLDPNVTASVLRLCSLLASPPECPQLKSVVSVSLRCLTRFHSVGGVLPTEVTNFLSGLGRAVAQLAQTPEEATPFYLAGREKQFQQWHNLLKMPSIDCESLDQAIGAELAMATAAQREFRPRIAATVRDLLAEHMRGDPISAAHQAKNLADRLMAEATRVLSRCIDTQSRKSVLFCARVTGHLIGQMDPAHLTSRQAAGSIRSLTPEETRRTAGELRSKAEAGDILSTATITAYCSGLPWDITLDIPFSSVAGEDWLALIDLESGETQVDLATALPQMARALPHHTPATSVVVRPLPNFLTNLLRALVASNPDATCLRDLLPHQAPSSRLRLDATDRALGISVARFVNSRGPLAIECGIDRTIAALTTMDLTLVGKAKHHYLTVDRTELWQATCSIYRELDWGAPSSAPTPSSLAAGARVTPDEALIRRIDLSFTQNFKNLKPGRRYTEATLLEGSNAFARLCALRATFFWSARGASTYPILANELTRAHPFGRLKDKGSGPHPGETPLPIPGVLARQVEFWELHLMALDRRLEKLGWTSTHPVRVYISDVLACKEIPLFFMIQAGRIQTLGSKNLFESLPLDIKINRDAFRHFVPNRLRKNGVPSSYVDAYVRHHTEGIALSSASCSVSQIQWLSAVANGLDQLAVELNMRPIPGLARKM